MFAKLMKSQYRNDFFFSFTPSPRIVQHLIKIGKKTKEKPNIRTFWVKLISQQDPTELKAVFDLMNANYKIKPPIRIKKFVNRLCEDRVQDASFCKEVMRAIHSKPFKWRNRFNKKILKKLNELHKSGKTPDHIENEVKPIWEKYRKHWYGH